MELLTIASTTPLRDALRGIQQIADASRAVRGEPIGLGAEDALYVVDALLGEPDRSTRGDIEVRSDRQAIDVTKMASISTIIQVVED